MQQLQICISMHNSNFKQKNPVIFPTLSSKFLIKWISLTLLLNFLDSFYIVIWFLVKVFFFLYCKRSVAKQSV